MKVRWPEKIPQLLQLIVDKVLNAPLTILLAHR